VTCSYFEVLQQPPALGRNLARRDCEPGADPVAVLGHSLWTTAFDADPAVIGRTIDLNRQSVTVIGIAPNLFLARAAARGGEIALRMSLGATRTRVVRQLMVESLFVFVAGGALGSVLALWSVEGLTAMALSSLAAVGAPALFVDTSPDSTVLAFAIALSFGTGLL